MMTSSSSTRSLPRTHVWLHHGLPLLLALSSLLIALAGPSASVPLRYERAAKLDGALWRLESGHLVPLGRLARPLQRRAAARDTAGLLVGRRRAARDRARQTRVGADIRLAARHHRDGGRQRHRRGPPLRRRRRRARGPAAALTRTRRASRA